MPVFAALGEHLSHLTVAILQSNEVLTDSCQKYLEDDDDIWWEGKKRKMDGRYYPILMHGPNKHCRPIITGNEPFVTASSAEKAAQLILHYARQLEPWPEGYAEEQPLLFALESLPENKKAA